ncbi:MAG: acyl-CoA dehydrogenase family protein, partial [Solirubrobacteraceae bacterium]
MTLALDREEAFLDEVARIAREVAAAHAVEVDRDARFPAEAVAALRDAGALSAFVPVALGGDGVSLRALARACTELGRACSSSAMVFAMHQIQVSTIVRHLDAEGWYEAYLRRVVAEQRLVASVTSEIGTGGDMGRSIAPVTPGEDGMLGFEKQAPTVSYGAHADDLFTTVR